MSKHMNITNMCFLIHKFDAAAALRSLKDEWTNTPPSWDNSGDPCTSWDGVVCNNSSRVTSL